MKKYSVKSIFGPTIQGEGFLTGEVSLFVRLAGCNMWDGREATKAASACPYCDTDFLGGEMMDVGYILARCQRLHPGGWITISGGEPLLQLEASLVFALKNAGYKIAVETNGTKKLPAELIGLVDHLALSPKVPMKEIFLKKADSIKVLFPHPNPEITPEAFESYPAEYQYIQPVNNYDTLDVESCRLAANKIYQINKRGGKWRASFQLHKAASLP